MLKIISNGILLTTCSLTSCCNFPPQRVAQKATLSLHGRAGMSHTDGTKVHLTEFPFKPETPAGARKGPDPGRRFK